MKHLDLIALRSFVAVAETGGVTRAAGYLNLTQSAVSMQVKRLEQVLDTALLERSGRGVALTGSGEELLSIARRMLDLNDDALRRLGRSDCVPEIVLGVPHDIVFPAIPEVLKQFSAAYPLVKIQLVSSLTRDLKDRFAHGEMDMILTTESHPGPGAETLKSLLLLWVGAPGGQAWRRRPLRLAMERNCVFTRDIKAALDAAGIAWEMSVESNNFRSVGAMLVADLAVCPILEGTLMRDLEEVRHGGSLPDLGSVGVHLYQREHGVVQDALAAMLRHAYA